MQYDTVLYISAEINKSRWSCHRKSKQKPLGNNYAHFMKIALAWRPMKDNSVTRCPRSSRICRRGSTSGYHVFGNPTHFNELTERLIYLIQTQTQSSCILIYWVEVACSQILCYGALRMPSQGLQQISAANRPSPENLRAAAEPCLASGLATTYPAHVQTCLQPVRSSAKDQTRKQSPTRHSYLISRNRAMMFEIM